MKASWMLPGREWNSRSADSRNVTCSFQGASGLRGTGSSATPREPGIVSGHFDERSTLLLPLPTLKLSDRLGRKQIFKRGKQELIPVLGAGLELLQEANGRCMDRDTGEAIPRADHVQSMVLMVLMFLCLKGANSVAPTQTSDRQRLSAVSDGRKKVRGARNLPRSRPASLAMRGALLRPTLPPRWLRHLPGRGQVTPISARVA